MRNPEFPIYLEQISVRTYTGFFFTLPERYIGRDDVKIYVEYGVAEEQGKVLYNVWAQMSEQSIRAFIMAGATTIDAEENVIDKIVAELNDSDEFHETIEHFIQHFDRQ